MIQNQNTHMRAVLYICVAIVGLTSCKKTSVGPQPWRTEKNVECFLEKMPDTDQFQVKMYYKGATSPFDRYWPVTLVGDKTLPSFVERTKVTLERDETKRGRCFYSNNSEDPLHGELLAKIASE